MQARDQSTQATASGGRGVLACGLDKVTVAVDNLERARRSFAALGFTVSPRSRHVGRGTGSCSVVMPGVGNDGTQIELMAQIDAHEVDEELRGRLAAFGEGLLSFCVKSDNADRSRDALSDAVTGEPAQAYRSVDQEGVSKMASFNLLNLLAQAGKRPGANLIENLTPELMFQPSWQDHENTAVAIREIHVRSDSVRADVVACAPFCTPAQTEAQARDVEARLDGKRVARLTYLSDKSWTNLYGAEDETTAGLVIECSSAIAAKSTLEAAGFEPEFVNSRLNGYRVPVSTSHGIWLTFVSA